MKKLFKILLIFTCISVFLFSCKKDEEIKTPDLGYNYAPAEVGSWIIYDVDSVVADISRDTFKFQIKEVIQSSYADAEGRPALRIERYKRDFNDTVPYSSIPWTLKDVWSANKTKTTFEKVEENIRFVKLTFPVKENNTWNGNAQNTTGEWRYEYSDKDRMRTIGTLTFDSTSLVTQIDEENLIAKKHYVEIYARNVGMIYKSIIDVESQGGVNFALPIMSRITKGTVCTFTINSYGK